jgi:hypothetical protein
VLIRLEFFFFFFSILLSQLEAPCPAKVPERGRQMDGRTWVRLPGLRWVELGTRPWAVSAHPPDRRPCLALTLDGNPQPPLSQLNENILTVRQFVFPPRQMMMISVRLYIQR